MENECHHPDKCLREVSPGSGIFFGEAFVYDEDFMACYLCKRELERLENRKKEVEKEKENGYSTKIVNGESESL
jgi:hypothetical protein